MPIPDLTRKLPLVAVLALAVTLAACNRSGQDQAASQQMQMPPLPVSIVTVKPERTAITSELPGRIVATRSAQVRARVPGIVLERVFTEGTDVEAGDVLFRIDPAPLEAAYQAAAANLQSAEAALFEARQTEKRYAPLVKQNAISRQQYDQAVAARRQAEALVAQQKAALDKAKLDLGYATVTAPISGRIGNALVTEGALVGQGEPTPMALIQQLDPIYVDFTQSSSQLLQLHEAILAGKLTASDIESTPVTLVLPTGARYAHEGKLLFSGISVDPTTGQISLRAEFPNPDKLLLPGMYVRGQIAQGVVDNVISVPIQAIQRNPDGSAYVYVVDENNTVQPRPIVAGAMMSDRWVVESGLQPGDRVVLNRFQQLRPGAPVQPVPAGAAPAPGAPAPSAAPQQQAGEAATPAPQRSVDAENSSNDQGSSTATSQR